MLGRPLPSTRLGQQPFFSPDGQRVGFVTNDRQLKVISLTGEPPLTLVNDGMARSGGSWGLDGYMYVKWQPNGQGLSRVHATTGGEPEPITTIDTARGETGHLWPDVLPGGRGVLFTVEHTQDQGQAEVRE